MTDPYGRILGFLDAFYHINLNTYREGRGEIAPLILHLDIRRKQECWSFKGVTVLFTYFQPIENYSEWRLLYFIAFILLVGFFVLNMFVGVVVENFHRCREEQEKEERVRRAAKRAKQMEKKRRSMFAVRL
jgi:hypothetical protein